MLLVLSNKAKGMQNSSEQPLVGEEHCVTTLITDAKESDYKRVVITFSDGTVSSANSLINLCICSVCNVALNFCGDSFSQINCFGRCNHVSLITGVGTRGLVD